MINLIKLCVGIDSVSHLEEVRKRRKEAGQRREDGLIVHRTRFMPKRRDEIISKGSLYWVIAGKIQCRQNIIDLSAQIDGEGKNCCDIIMDAKIIRTIPFPKRPFQGWRYLPKDDAPNDLNSSLGEGDAKLAAELASLGLI